MGYGNGNDCPPENRAISSASWGEYAQWLVGRRRRFVVREDSMVPTLRSGDTVLAAMGARVQLGDIAIATHPLHPNMLLIKRVQDIFDDGSVYLISDNTHGPNVRDSRHFGVLTASGIIGRVTSRLATAT